jgi:hypothetical protein
VTPRGVKIWLGPADPSDVGEPGQDLRDGFAHVWTDPGGPPERDLTESVQTWLNGALMVDRYDLALRLAEQLSSGPGAPHAVLTRAQILLFTGRRDEAVRVLADSGRLDLPDRAPVNEETLTVVACLAAGGDDQMYRRLISVPQQDHWLPSYLLGAVAEQRGDQAISDQAWTTAVQQSPLTPYTYPRWACATVQRRNRQSDVSAVQTVVQVAQACRHLPHDLATAPEPVLAAASLLEARGDVAGARLLITAVDRLLPPVPAIKNRLVYLTPPGMRRYRWTARALVLLAVLLAPSPCWRPSCPSAWASWRR